MALIEQNARLRDQGRIVSVKRVRRLLRKVWAWIKPNRHPHIKDLDPRLARDAGIDANALARYQHRLPSQHDHHPRS